MKCYHCKSNEAEYRFFVNYMGNMGEIQLCGECVEKFRRYAQNIFKGLGGSGMETWGISGPPISTFRPTEPERDFPMDAGDEMRRRRLINELSERLRDAVDREDYETAAGLRDEIAQFQSTDKTRYII